MHIIGAWKHFKNIETSSWFCDECSQLLEQKKQANLQWLQNRSRFYRDNTRNAQRKSADCQERKTGYLKEDSAGKINSEKNSIRKLYSGMNGLEGGREYKIYSVKKL